MAGGQPRDYGRGDPNEGSRHDDIADEFGGLPRLCLDTTLAGNLPAGIVMGCACEPSGLILRPT